MIDTRVCRIHLLDFAGGGAGPTLVLLHGLGADCLSFANLVFRLRPHFSRVIIPDLPGHGWSEDVDALTPAEMMRGLCDALDEVLDEPAAFVGTSLGGMCAARYAAMRPSNVESLVLVAPGGAPLDSAGFERLLATFEIDDHAAAMDFVGRCFVKTPRAVRRVLALGVRRRMGDPALRATIARFTPEDMLRPGELATIRAPTLLIWGSEERLLPEGVLDFFRAHLPRGARIERWSHFGHAGFLEQPRVVAQRIVGFTREGALEARSVPQLRWPASGATLAASP